MLAVLVLASTATPLAAQQVRGTVQEAPGGLPMADAAVTIVDDRGQPVLQVLTDSAGLFTTMLPRVGVYSLRVEKIGYRTVQTETLEIRNAEVLELRILIGVEAVPLTPLQVRARYSDTRSDFHRRVEWGRRTGSGVFFTREEIEQSSYVRTSSMLLSVPSIRLIHARDGNVYLGPSERGAYNCRSAVFIDGVESHLRLGLDALSPTELEGVEVYRFRSEIPTELAGSNVCSAVSFWTRVGTPGSGSSWRGVLAVGAVVAATLSVFMLVR